MRILLRAYIIGEVSCPHMIIMASLITNLIATLGLNLQLICCMCSIKVSLSVTLMLELT